MKKVLIRFMMATRLKRMFENFGKSTSRLLDAFMYKRAGSSIMPKITAKSLAFSEWTNPTPGWIQYKLQAQQGLCTSVGHCQRAQPTGRNTDVSTKTASSLSADILSTIEVIHRTVLIKTTRNCTHPRQSPNVQLLVMEKQADLHDKLMMSSCQGSHLASCLHLLHKHDIIQHCRKPGHFGYNPTA